MDKLSPSRTLLQRRQTVLSPTYFHHYDTPIHAVRASGVTIWDESGRAYLDCYNNVPSVGHCHPHVISALTQQASMINSHSRYLDDNIVRYAERLVATLPAEIDTCAFVCSGTEANALAYDMARAVTGNKGVLVSDGSYHGNALAVADFSLFGGPPSETPGFVRSVPVPNPHETNDETETGSFGKKLANGAAPIIRELAKSRHGLAMFIVDPIFDAPGIFTTPPNYLAEMSRNVRSMGGLVVVDEVQSGLTRLGDSVWGFMDSGVVPDIVTMGKPIGAGYPLAVVVSTREIFSTFSKKRQYFNTFGGTPVAGAVGNAVFDVIEENYILENVNSVGRFLKSELDTMSRDFDFMDGVRGKGLFLGIPLVSDKSSRRPDPKRAAALVNQMKRNGVLVSVCGASNSIVKIRPPLVFSHNNARQLLDTLRHCLTASDQVM